MKKLLTLLSMLSLSFALGAKDPLPKEVMVKGVFGQHVQSMAADTVARCFYLSFTTRFLKVDYDGNILASIDAINGHLGGMTFDYKTRKVYTTLEYKGDEIGRNISRQLGKEAYDILNTHFCLTIIDVDKLTEIDTPAHKVMVAYEIFEVKNDYVQGNYGCSGIDGITIAPAIGKKGRRLYIAYGVYSDVNRKDNDHQILLEYKLSRLFAPSRKLFVYTGNTTYGVQNMAYDPATDNIFLACYGGKKEEFPNFSIYAVPVQQEAKEEKLRGLEDDGKHLKLNLADAGIGHTGDLIRGWSFYRLTAGFCSLGDGNWYVAMNTGKHGSHGCTIRMYHYTGKKTVMMTPVN